MPELYLYIHVRVTGDGADENHRSVHTDVIGSRDVLNLGHSGFSWWSCSDILVVLFDTLGVSKCHNTLFLSSLHL